MGGNAIKNVDRMDIHEYEFVQSVVMFTIMSANSSVKSIPFYSNKDSFGDIDLIVSNSDVSNLIEKIKEEYDLKEDDYIKNGNVFSFRAKLIGNKSFQVDLIFVPKDEMDVACNYFAYNDLSNLLGRMTKKLGFKLGHNGLFYIERDKDHVVVNERFSKNYYDALDFLKLDVDRYNQGFDKLEDIFEYVASSPYFNPHIFLLQNRNHISRTRDKKRKTYNAFLQWCEENKDRLNYYDYDDVTDAGGYGNKNNVKERVVNKIFEKYPELYLSVLESRYYYHLNKEFKKYFNGNILRDCIKEQYDIEVSGKELGVYISIIKRYIDNKIKLNAVRCKHFPTKLYVTHHLNHLIKD